MKKLFPGHYLPNDDDLKEIWETGLFVFDTNVLLNVYSYPDSLREVFFNVLEKIADRSWIPYQVALEFHKNKLIRIKNSNKPLLDLRNKVRSASQGLEDEVRKIEFEKRNTGIENLDEILAAMRDSHTKLAEALALACDRLPHVSLEDPIGSRLSEIFHNRVGAPPSNQEELDFLVSDGNERYENKIPPGFADAKDKKDITYRDRELKYQGMFGDLILWKQTINHIKEKNIKSVIFVTSDSKEDWFLTIDKKIIGPSPELIHEFHEKTDVENFWIYRADQFLKNSETYLDILDLTDEMVAQVQEASTKPEKENEDSTFKNDNSNTLDEQSKSNKLDSNERKKRFFFTEDFLSSYDITEKNRINHLPSMVHKYVREWAKDAYLDAVFISGNISEEFFLNFNLMFADKNLGFLVTPLTHWRNSIIRDKIDQAKEILENGKIDEIVITIVLHTEEWNKNGYEKIENKIINLIDFSDFEKLISFVVGTIDFNIFTPEYTLTCPNSLLKSTRRK